MLGNFENAIIIRDRNGEDIVAASSFEDLVRCMRIWHVTGSYIIAGDKFFDFFIDTKDNKVVLVDNDDDTDDKWRDGNKKEVRWFFLKFKEKSIEILDRAIKCGLYPEELQLWYYIRIKWKDLDKIATTEELKELDKYWQHLIVKMAKERSNESK